LIRDYYYVTKPGIVYGNIFTLVAGFFLASSQGVNYTLLFFVVVGLSCVIASGCVFNNYIDKDIDGLMERTKNRALVKGRITEKHARIYGAILGSLGFSILLLSANTLTFIASLIGFLTYVFVYSSWLKRTSVHSTIIGGIAGAMPPVVGYLSVSNHIDIGCVLLFIILTLWQMPHFFGIAINRLTDYEQASIPVLPVEKGISITKVQTPIYVVLFVIATLLLPFFGYTGTFYFVSMSVLGILFFIISLRGFYVSEAETRGWAKKVFAFSIIILMCFCLSIVIERLFF
jgi:protoheme IX farnesyltransferase